MLSASFFGYHKWESLSAVLLGLGRLNFKHLVMLRKVKFYWHLYCSTDVFLRDMFLLCYFKYDSILESVFIPDLMLSVMFAFLLTISNYIVGIYSFLGIYFVLLIVLALFVCLFVCSPTCFQCLLANKRVHLLFVAGSWYPCLPAKWRSTLSTV